jgi:hypothetical protein
MNSKRYQEASTSLAKFLIVMKTHENDTGLVWYHALCLDCLLDVTMTCCSYETCCQFFVDNMECFLKCDREASSRFYANSMLWNMRLGCVEVAEFWKRKLMKQFEISMAHSIVGTYTGLRLVETLTLEAVYQTEVRNFEELKIVEAEIAKVSVKIAAGVKNSNMFDERHKLHQLHLQMLKSFDKSKLPVLKQLEMLALSKNDFLAIDIIKFTRLFWKGNLKSKEANYWQRHSTEDTTPTIEQLSTHNRMYTFSLPLRCTVLPIIDIEIA